MIRIPTRIIKAMPSSIVLPIDMLLDETFTGTAEAEARLENYVAEVLLFFRDQGAARRVRQLYRKTHEAAIAGDDYEFSSAERKLKQFLIKYWPNLDGLENIEE